MAANPKTKVADKSAEKNNTGEDQSMEDILQSIRKIIADEGDEPAAQASDTQISDSDILELTDAIQEDGSVVNVTEQSHDVMADIDKALAADEKIETVFTAAGEETKEPVVEPTARIQDIAPEEPILPSAPKPAVHKTVTPPVDEGLVSNINIAAAAEAMKALRQPHGVPVLGGLHFASGDTVEGLVAQLLRPMLKEWLDANLAAIVQQEVKREVQRIAASIEE